MTSLFIKMLSISITASWIVLAVILLRFALRRAPKWLHCVLWVIVALRLLLPVVPQSRISLIPRDLTVQQTVQTDVAPQVAQPEPDLPIDTEEPADSQSHILQLLSKAWIGGIGAMLLYGAVSYLRLRWQVRVALRQDRNVYICDQIYTPFVLGVFRPRIYVPSGIEEDRLQHILAHENAHIRRRDHWWKPLGFVLLAVYWFNPVLWLGYILLCRDIECACDEKVVAQMDDREKKQYSETLLVCSIHRRMVLACPVAFGEIAVKDRIKGVLNYKKPAFWIVVVSVVTCAVMAVCFLTDPKTCKHEYSGQILLDSTCSQAGAERFTCTLCDDSYTEALPLLAHNYDQGVVTAQPTCVQTGSKLLTCTDCGATATETLAVTAHTAEQITVLKEATCTEAGRMSSVCTVCNVTFEQELSKDANAHHFEEKVIRASTCSSQGEGLRTCTRCNHQESCTYPLRAHNYVDYGLLYRTCYVHERQQICTECEWIRKVKLNDYGHNFVNGRCTSCGQKEPSGNEPFGSTTSGPFTGQSANPGPIVWDPAGSINPTKTVNSHLYAN